MIQKVYGVSAVHRATVFHWYNIFSEGQESIFDEQRSACENIAHVADVLKKDRRSLC